MSTTLPATPTYDKASRPASRSIAIISGKGGSGKTMVRFRKVRFSQ